MINNRKPLLVTGSHRSGSTWLGDILSSSGAYTYFHEPFNPLYPACGCGFSIEKWYLYLSVSDENEKARIHFEHLLNKEPLLLSSFLKTEGIWEKKVSLKRSLQLIKSRILQSGKPLLMKDPIALLSAPWLCEQFNMDCLISVRHPAAFTHSLKRKNWEFPFKELVTQKLLMKELLIDYEADIERLSKENLNIIEQSAWIWRILHSVILKHKKSLSGIQIVRYEDLAAEPIKEFKRLFEALNLDFSDEVEKKIKSVSLRKGKTGPKGTEEQKIRDSRMNVSEWKNQLSAEEIKMVRQITEPVAQEFYRTEEW